MPLETPVVIGPMPVPSTSLSVTVIRGPVMLMPVVPALRTRARVTRLSADQPSAVLLTISIPVRPASCATTSVTCVFGASITNSPRSS